MLTPRGVEPLRLLPAALLAAAALLLAAGSQGAQSPTPAVAGASAWRGFVDGGRSEVAVGQRVIVVLNFTSEVHELTIPRVAPSATVLLGSHRPAGERVDVRPLRLRPLESVVLQP